MLPLRFFRSRGFTAANVVSFLMYFGVFGAVFLLVQFFQIVQGLSPFQSGLRTLPWTAMPAIVAPIAGVLAGRIGGRPILVAGMVALAAGLAWIAAVITPTVAYPVLVPGFILAGVGMGLFFAPIANVVLSSVDRIEEGQASGATNTIREIGGVFGVAVLASVFSANGSYATPSTFVDGLVPAVWVGAAIVAVGAVVALALPGSRTPRGHHRSGTRGARRAKASSGRRYRPSSPGGVQPLVFGFDAPRRPVGRGERVASRSSVAVIERGQPAGVSRLPVNVSASAELAGPDGPAPVAPAPLARVTRRSSPYIRSVASASASTSDPSPVELAQPTASRSETAPDSSQRSHALRTRSM